VFAKTRRMMARDIPEFVVNNECTERVMITQRTELAFGTHTEMAAKFFAEVGG